MSCLSIQIKELCHCNIVEQNTTVFGYSEKIFTGQSSFASWPTTRIKVSYLISVEYNSTADSYIIQ